LAREAAMKAPVFSGVTWMWTRVTCMMNSFVVMNPG